MKWNTILKSFKMLGNGMEYNENARIWNFKKFSICGAKLNGIQF